MFVHLPNYLNKVYKMKTKNIYARIVSSLNIYYFISWIYIFNKYNNQIERQLSFMKSWGGFFKDINYLDLLLSILTISSIILIFYRQKNNLKLIDTILIFIHFLFLFYMLLTHL